ncbi:tripartite tricarboxylate transporter TctB family protein [Solicola sp. PLA-1-18]|uniref:tripartite tricarboxylate transporter TctB family protein n=1 Tax=Solicola sp. PLA-1-18 TaxID=3380532 RepID=UPI003B7AB214
MSTETTPPRTDAPEDRGIDRGQLAVAGGIAVVGAYVLLDAARLNVGFADPVGPKFFPYCIGTVLIVLGVLLAVATLRGDEPEAEGGEDVDLSQKTDWQTVLRLLAVFAANIVLVDLLGWAITGGLLFAGAAWALGSRTILRDLVVGLVLSVGSWYFFYVVLGIPLTPGVLDGVL